jgi:predicted HTH domain antitoxin
MEKAAMIAGLNRRDFLLELSAREIDVFHVDLNELETEVTR